MYNILTKTDVTITSTHGQWIHLNNKSWQHAGMDFGVYKVNVFSWATGKVVEISTSYGGIAIQDNNTKLIGWYLHLEKINVTKGQNIKIGDLIGVSGNKSPDGNSTGYHLHFQLGNHIWVGNRFPRHEESIDPNSYIIGKTMTDLEKQFLVWYKKQRDDLEKMSDEDALKHFYQYGQDDIRYHLARLRELGHFKDVIENNVKGNDRLVTMMNQCLLWYTNRLLYIDEYIDQGKENAIKERDFLRQENSALNIKLDDSEKARKRLSDSNVSLVDEIKQKDESIAKLGEDNKILTNTINDLNLKLVECGKLAGTNVTALTEELHDEKLKNEKLEKENENMRKANSQLKTIKETQRRELEELRDSETNKWHKLYNALINIFKK